MIQTVLLLVGSVVLSLIFFLIGFPFFVMFLFIPLIPMLKKRENIKVCPVCGWKTRGDEVFCPYDGTELIISK